MTILWEKREASKGINNLNSHGSLKGNGPLVESRDALVGLRYDLDVSTATAGRGRMQMLEPAFYV